VIGEDENPMPLMRILRSRCNDPPTCSRKPGREGNQSITRVPIHKLILVGQVSDENGHFKGATIYEREGCRAILSILESDPGRYDATPQDCLVSEAIVVGARHSTSQGRASVIMLPVQQPANEVANLVHPIGRNDSVFHLIDIGFTRSRLRPQILDGAIL